VRKLLFNLHLYFALVAGVFIAILGITGAIMAFEPELDHLMHPHRSYVKPEGQPKSLVELAAIAQTQEQPGQRPLAFQMSPSANIAWAVGFRDGVVYVNQYTGEVLGVDRSQMNFLGYVHQLHLRLLTPLWLPNRDQHQVGKKIMSWAGAASLFLIVSGLYLWWPTKRVRVQWRSGERRSWFDLHNAVGIVSLVFLLVLSLTGVVIGFDEESGPMLYKLTGSQPVPRPSPKIEARRGVPLISPDQVVQIARATLPGAVPVAVSVPNPQILCGVSMRYPEDLTPGGRSRVYIDPYSGQVVQAESSRTTAAGTKLVILNRALHTGDIFGMPSKIAMSLASFAIFVQFVSGLVMWWKRTRAQKRANRGEKAAVAAS